MRHFKYIILFFLPAAVYPQVDPVILSDWYGVPNTPEIIYELKNVNGFPSDKDLMPENLSEVEIKNIRQKFMQEKKNNVWLYLPAEVTDSISDNVTVNIIIANIGEVFEVYWDGKLVGKRGHILKPSDKWNKAYFHQINIPFDYTAIGKHSILIKVYFDWAYHNTEFGFMQVGFNLFMTKAFERNIIPMITYYVLFVSAIFFFLLFLGLKKFEYLFFSFSCLAFGLRAYFFPMYYLEDFGLGVDEGNSFIASAVLPVAFFSFHAYLLFKLSIIRKYKWQSVLILLSSMSIFFLSEFNYIRLAIAIAALISIFGLIKKDYSSIFILIGLTGFWILARDSSHPIQKGMIGYQGLLFLIVTITILSSIEIARNNKKHRESILKASRLENELLKRNIQPHFILNTLTALQEVIVKSPELASSLIEALADEFRLFSKVSGEKLINIKDEITICESHLKIMEFRKGAKFTLKTEGILGDEMVPPGIFHTIIENGTTHGYSEIKEGIFILTRHNSKAGIKYTLFNNGRSEDEKADNKKGTGIKYIEARLEESFPGLWDLKYGPTPEGWEVIIEIKNINGKKK